MYHFLLTDLYHYSQFVLFNTDNISMRRGLFLFIYLIIQINVFAGNRYTVPYSNTTIKSYELSSIVDNDFKRIKSGELATSYADYIAEFKRLNPSATNIGYSFVQALDEEFINVVQEQDSTGANALAIAYNELSSANDSFNKINDKAKILEHGVSNSSLLSLDPSLMNTYIDEFGDKLEIKDLNDIVSQRTDLDKETIDNIVQKAFNITTEDYDYSDIDTQFPKELINLINGNNIDISKQVCGSMMLLYEFLSEDEEGGTLWGLDQANEDDWEEEYKQTAREAYAYNVEEVAATVIKFERLGYGLDTQCGQGQTLRDLIYSYDDMISPIDVFNDIRDIKDVNQRDCFSESVTPSVSKEFGSCDMAHIIWRLNREDKYPLHHNQTRIYGEGMENCDIMIEMSVRGLTKTTSLKMRSGTGTTFVEGSTQEVIRRISK